jgi:hypothetical protein
LYGIEPLPDASEQYVLGEGKMRVMTEVPVVDGLLPLHGRTDCSACFAGKVEWGVSCLREHDWMLENNPLALGARNPKKLLLGFSKGVRQSTELLARRLEDVAFAGFRPRITQAMQVLELLSPGDCIENHFRADEPDWAFGDVIRCSVAKWDPASGKYLKSGDVIAAAARRTDGADWIANCMSRLLAKLPPRLETVVLLSNDDTYVDACFERVRLLHPDTRRINKVAYGNDRVTWPSPH